MKKLTLILLSLVLCVSLFACGESGESSSEASKDNSSSGAVSESESSVNDESSKTLSEDSSESGSEPEGVDSGSGGKKVVYFTGEYELFVMPGIYYGNGLREEYSDGNDSLGNYLKNNEVSADTYFLVGLNFHYEKAEDRETAEKLLSDAGFIEDAENRFSNKNNPYNSALVNGTEEEQQENRVKRFELLMPDVDISEYEAWQLDLVPVFETVGYLNAETYDYINENTEIVIDITWFPSPEENVRWLDSTNESNQS